MTGVQTCALPISPGHVAVHTGAAPVQSGIDGNAAWDTAHVRAIPAVRAFVAEFTKESAFGPNGYLRQAGLIAAPNGVRARAQMAARNLTPVKFAELK